VTQKQVGFRSPLFEFGPWTWQALSSMGFLYHMDEKDNDPDVLGAELGNKLWPFTMDSGDPTPCWSSTCDYTAHYPGLWTIPFPTLDEYDSTKPNYRQVLYDINPPLNGTALQNYYYNNFMASYNGNRAPFGINLQPSWLLADPTRVTWLNAFIAQLLAMPDVYFVSGADVIAYMQNPVAAGSTTVPFACPGSTATPPSSSTTSTTSTTSSPTTSSPVTTTTGSRTPPSTTSTTGNPTTGPAPTTTGPTTSASTTGTLPTGAPALVAGSPAFGVPGMALALLLVGWLAFL
jgi:hypothetical protein